MFRREGELWRLAFAGRAALLRDAKGLRDLATLLAAPGREHAALDLTAEGVPARRPVAHGELDGPAADLGETVDATARAAYQARIRELEAELDEADTAGDPERSARSQAERDSLLEQLAQAYGLGGRARRTGSPAERARTAVTARIRDSIRRIEQVHPELGRHLRKAVRTGIFCAYDPEEPVAWRT